MSYTTENWRRIYEIDLAVVQSFGAFSPGGRFLAAADTNTIEVREARGGAILATVEMLAVTSLAVSPDGTLLVAADDDGHINAWRLQPVAPLWRAQLTMPPPAFAQIVYDVQFAAQGGLVVASKPAGVDNILIELWPVDPALAQLPEPRWRTIMFDSDYRAFSPSPDASGVLVATDDGYWFVRADGERLFIDEFYESGDYAVLAFDPYGRLAAGIEPEGGWIYEVSSHAMREIANLEVLEEPTDVAWSPDGQALIITSEDGLSLCGADSDGFSYLGLIDDTAGFEAAAFIDAQTIAAKRGDSLLVFSSDPAR